LDEQSAADGKLGGVFRIEHRGRQRRAFRLSPTRDIFPQLT
jgi:hypothetical protein